MASKRIYITLNADKEKDMVIINYLSNCYSEKDAIKESLYRLAIQSNDLVQSGNESTKKVQLAPNDTEKMQLDTKRNDKIKEKNEPNSYKKVQKGDNVTLKMQNGNESIEKELAPNGNEKVQSDTLTNKKDDVLLDIKDMDGKHIEVKNEVEIEKNELDQLQKFM